MLTGLKFVCHFFRKSDPVFKKEFNSIDGEVLFSKFVKDRIETIYPKKRISPLKCAYSALPNDGDTVSKVLFGCTNSKEELFFVIEEGEEKDEEEEGEEGEKGEDIVTIRYNLFKKITAASAQAKEEGRKLQDKLNGMKECYDKLKKKMEEENVVYEEEFDDYQSQIRELVFQNSSKGIEIDRERKKLEKERKRFNEELGKERKKFNEELGKERKKFNEELEKERKSFKEEIDKRVEEKLKKSEEKMKKDIEERLMKEFDEKLEKLKLEFSKND